METQESGLKTVENAYMESRRILRTPSALARDALLYVQEIGEMTCKEPRQNWRNSLDSYLLILVEEGCGTVTVERKPLPCKRGMWRFWTATSHILIAVMPENRGKSFGYTGTDK